MTRRANIVWLSLATGILTVAALGFGRFFLSPDARVTFTLLTWLMWAVIGADVVLNLWMFVSPQSQKVLAILPSSSQSPMAARSSVSIPAIASNQSPSIDDSLPSRLLGWRIYDLDGQNLQSPAMRHAPSYDWHRPAMCLNGYRHEAPDARCVCGYYAFNITSINMALSYAVDQCYPRRCVCLALVSGWGKAVLTKDGWRSQFQRIEAIADYGTYEKKLLAMKADGLAVPILSLEMLRKDAESWQEEVVDDAHRKADTDSVYPSTRTTL